MTVGEINRKEIEQKALSLPAAIGKRLLSVRISYRMMVMVACWLVFALAIYFLRALGFIDPR